MDYQSALISVVVIVAAVFIFRIISRFFSKPKAKPQTVRVRISGREESEETDRNGFALRYILFHVPSTGEDLRIQVSRRVYREIPESGSGTLTYAGDQFMKYESKGMIIEK